LFRIVLAILFKNLQQTIVQVARHL